MNNVRLKNERHCIVCGAPMQKVCPEGVEIDVCAKHGVWLDNGELEKIIIKVREKLQRESDAKIAKANHDGRTAGIWWGWLSLIFDCNPVDVKE